MENKNVARLYVGANKIDGNGGWKPYTCCLCTLQSPYIVPGLVPTGFTHLRISFVCQPGMSTRFSKIVSK